MFHPSWAYRARPGFSPRSAKGQFAAQGIFKFFFSPAPGSLKCVPCSGSCFRAGDGQQEREQGWSQPRAAGTEVLPWQSLSRESLSLEKPSGMGSKRPQTCQGHPCPQGSHPCRDGHCWKPQIHPKPPLSPHPCRDPAPFPAPGRENPKSTPRSSCCPHTALRISPHWG